MIVVFDYIFFRIFSFFREKGDSVPETMGTAVLTLMQVLIVIDAFLINKILF